MEGTGGQSGRPGGARGEGTPRQEKGEERRVGGDSEAKAGSLRVRGWLSSHPLICLGASRGVSERAHSSCLLLGRGELCFQLREILNEAQMQFMLKSSAQFTQLSASAKRL